MARRLSRAERKAMPPAMTAAGHDARRRGRVRRFVTPEGVDLELEIASAGQRFGALLLDFTFMLLLLIAVTFGLLYIGDTLGSNSTVIIWLLGFFLLRNFWFALFELGPRAATPGKRVVGIRVVARDGGRLTVAAVVARNLVREVELFLPLFIVFSSQDRGNPGAALIVSGLIWTLAMGLFLLFNRDRMRLGDLIGGTWVVQAGRRKMALDLAAGSAGAREPVFSPAELAIYGVYELQQLERVLRDRDTRTMIVVTDTIRAKLDRPPAETDEEFLEAYYRQAKARMERDLLFGKRRANKFETAQ